MVFVTITGADDDTQVDDLIQLSNEYPFVEWGILFSRKRQGTPRYPTAEWIASLIEKTAGRGVKISLHLCGGAAEEFIGLGGNVHPGVGRIQVNGYSPGFLSKVKRGHLKSCEVILQARSEDDLEVCAEDSLLHPNVSVLFDVSGGNGIAPSKWPSGLGCPAVKLGLAGGIGPDNVYEIASHAAAIGASWIDMESSVRVDNRFDVGLVRRVLDRVSSFNNSAENASGMTLNDILRKD